MIEHKNIHKIYIKMIELKMPDSAPELAVLAKIISIFSPILWSVGHLNQNIL